MASTSGQVSVINQKHCVREMLDRPTRVPRSLQIWRSVPGASGTPSGKVARPLHGSQQHCHNVGNFTRTAVLLVIATFSRAALRKYCRQHHSRVQFYICMQSATYEAGSCIHETVVLARENPVGAKQAVGTKKTQHSNASRRSGHLK